MNVVCLVGRVATEVTLRYTPEGTPVARFNLAVDRPGKDRGAIFVPVVTWGKAAEAAARYLQKGRLVSVRGRLEIRDYTGNDGQRRRATEVVGLVHFLPDGRRNGNGEAAQAHADEAEATPAPTEVPETAEDDLELEDVPF